MPVNLAGRAADAQSRHEAVAGGPANQMVRQLMNHACFVTCSGIIACLHQTAALARPRKSRKVAVRDIAVSIAKSK